MDSITYPRALFDTELWCSDEPYDTRSCYLYLVERAIARKTAPGQSLAPGQCSVSIRQLAQAWNIDWHSAQKKLKTLQKNKLVSVKKDGKKSIVTVLNFSLLSSERPNTFPIESELNPNTFPIESELNPNTFPIDREHETPVNELNVSEIHTDFPNISEKNEPQTSENSPSGEPSPKREESEKESNKEKEKEEKGLRCIVQTTSNGSIGVRRSNPPFPPTLFQIPAEADVAAKPVDLKAFTEYFLRRIAEENSAIPRFSLTERRRVALNARIKEYDRLHHSNPQNPDGREAIRRMVENAVKSDFLNGRTDNRNNQNPFIATIDWLTNKNNFAKTIEGNYNNHNNSQSKTSGITERGGVVRDIKASDDEYAQGWQSALPKKST